MESESERPSRAQDFLELTKPGILSFAVMTTAGTASLAPGPTTSDLWNPANAARK